jgi:amino acid transporter
MVKVLILSLFGIVGLFHLQPDHLLPVFNTGEMGVVMGAALIFVAYEGFELIPNAIHEMKDPERHLAWGIMISILIATAIYILVSLVAVGNLLPEEINRYKEYALAVAAKPFLGQAGFMLIGLGALLSTASAINATLFGTARLSMVMSQEAAIPKIFFHRERTKDIPNVSLIAITVVSLLFVNTSNLTIISSFASSTFLLMFTFINLSAFRLRRRIGIHPAMPLLGLGVSLASWVVLMSYLYKTHTRELVWIAGSYGAVVVAELIFSERRLIMRKS